MGNTKTSDLIHLLHLQRCRNHLVCSRLWKMRKVISLKARSACYTVSQFGSSSARAAVSLRGWLHCIFDYFGRILTNKLLSKWYTFRADCSVGAAICCTECSRIRIEEENSTLSTWKVICTWILKVWPWSLSLDLVLMLSVNYLYYLRQWCSTKILTFSLCLSRGAFPAILEFNKLSHRDDA